MKNGSHLKSGFGFGITSAVITTLGLMIGLEAGTKSKLAVLGGILTIAIADAFSDALGMHVSEESKNIHSHREVWVATAATFASKLIFALTFVIPVLFWPLNIAIWICMGWGLLLLAIFSFAISIRQKENSFKVVGEHLIIAIVVIVITHYFGHWIASVFA